MYIEVELRNKKHRYPCFITE